MRTLLLLLITHLVSAQVMQQPVVNTTPPSSSPFTLVEAKCASNPQVVTFSTATTVGELIVVGLAVGTTGVADGGVTDNASGGSSTYTSIVSHAAFLAGGQVAVNFYRAFNVASGITVITTAIGTGNSQANGGTCAAHYKGATTTDPLDVSKAWTAAQATPWSSTATGTLGQANEIVVGLNVAYLNGSGDPTFTSTGPLTQRAQISSNTLGISYSDEFVTSTASVTHAGTTSLAGTSNSTAIATFK